MSSLIARGEVAARPDSAAAWGTLGYTLQANGDSAGAAEAFAKAQALEPENDWRGWAAEAAEAQAAS